MKHPFDTSKNFFTKIAAHKKKIAVLLIAVMILPYLTQTFLERQEQKREEKAVEEDVYKRQCHTNVGCACTGDADDLDIIDSVVLPVFYHSCFYQEVSGLMGSAQLCLVDQIANQDRHADTDTGGT